MANTDLWRCVVNATPVSLCRAGCTLGRMPARLARQNLEWRRPERAACATMRPSPVLTPSSVTGLRFCKDQRCLRSGVLILDITQVDRHLPERACRERRPITLL